MKSLVWYMGVLAGALTGGLVSALFTFTLFILVGETMFYFLSLGVNALFAALGAGWLGNALAADGSRTRLLPIWVVSEVAAILAAVANVMFVDAASVRAVSQFTLGGRMMASVMIVVFAAAIATWILRSSDHNVGRDVRTTAILLVLALLYVIGGMILDGILVPIPA